MRGARSREPRRVRATAPSGTPRGMRRMTVRGEDWFWAFGNLVRIVGPDGRRHEVGLTDFSGHSWDDLERASWKGNPYDMTPAKVRDWIDRRILGYADASGMPAGALPKDWTAPAPADTRPVEGPRGTWRWRITPPIARGRHARRQLPSVDLISPEEVLTRHRVYEVTGQGVEAFFAGQRAAMTRAGVDPSGGREDPLGEILCHPIPEANLPTDAHVLAFVVGTVLRTAAPDAAPSEREK